MGKYGQAAIAAVQLIPEGQTVGPVGAWKSATRAIFPYSRSSREKGCPKAAFLGLCEEGLVAGAAAGDYTRSVDNKDYALRAVEILRANPQYAESESELWRLVMAAEAKVHNSQMDVVVALWASGLIGNGQ